MTQPSASDLQTRLQFALSAARQAGEFIMSYYQSPELAVERKRDATPVTAADRGAEQLIRGLLADAYPQDAILGEEFGEASGTSGWRWILDPVDGTKSFIHGVPLFGTLIGLEHEGQQVLGVCRMPALQEVIYGANGLGAWWQIADREPRRARVSEVTSLSAATFSTTTIQGWRRVDRQAAFDRITATAAISRGWGDCYGHALVATGRIDVMIDPLLNPWDCAPFIPILKEAGGSFVDFNGDESITTGNGLSINAGLKAEVLRMLSVGSTGPTEPARL